MIRPLPVLLAATLAPALVSACATSDALSPPRGFEHAIATRSCGPTDGPAVAIYLAGAPIDAAGPTAPFVLIQLWQDVASITRQDWPLADSGLAAASYYASAASSEPATSGSLHLTRINSDSSIVGTVSLRFAAAGTVTGGFTAAWRPASLLCG